jgi:Mg2+ and Co2+ transporter CorA
MDAPQAQTPHPVAQGYLYDAEGRDRAAPVERETLDALHDRALLWIDVAAREPAEIERLGRLLNLHPASVDALVRPKASLRLERYGDYLQFAVLPAPPESVADPQSPGRLDFLVGRNWLLTVHDGEIETLRSFRRQDKADTDIGALSGATLTASLLDWHLEAYFTEVSRIEAAVDHLDERILAAPSEERLLEAILVIRRRISRLRRHLAAERSVFYGLNRPDLTQVAESDAGAVFETLAARFERAVDEVEHTRDLVVGSFELFTSRSAQQTNDLVKALTFFTVIIGCTAAVAGLFGMNFDPPFFQTGSMGFFAVTAGLLVLGLVAWIVGRRRHWI